MIASRIASAWDLDPTVVIGCVVLAIAYGLACRRHFSRAGWFLLGDLVMLLALISPIDVLADRLGTNRGAIYKTLHDARRKLRQALIEEGHGEHTP